MSNAWRVLDDYQISRLDHAIFDVLSQRGMEIQNDTILEAVQRRGAKIEKGSRVAKFPEEVILELITEQKRRRDEENLEKSASQLSAVWGPECFSIYDWENRELRAGNMKDAIEMIHLGDTVDEVKTVSSVLVMNDFDLRVEPLESLAVRLQHTRKPGHAQAQMPQQIKYLIRMGEAYSGSEGETRFLDRWVSVTSPLILGRRVCELLLERGKFGIGMNVCTQATSGLNAPVTRAGTIVQASAEILATWMCFKAVFPRLDTDAGAGTGVFGAGKPSFCSPEAWLQNIAIYQLFEGLYGGNVWVLNTSTIDAKVPGFQAVFERTFAMTTVRFAAHPVDFVLGTLDNTCIFSPVQAMIDLELARGIWHFFRGLDVNDETLGIKTIKEVGLNKPRSYLATEHTRRNVRKELWLPKLLDRTGWRTDEVEAAQERRMLEKANEMWKMRLKEYQPFTIDRDVKDVIDKILREARKELLT